MVRRWFMDLWKHPTLWLIILIGLSAGVLIAYDHETGVTIMDENTVTLKFRPLNDQEVAALEGPLNTFVSKFGKERPLDLPTLQKFYDEIHVEHQNDELIPVVIGLAFGEHIQVQTGYEWVRVIDKYGEETVLSPQGVSLMIYPISMVQKRMKAGERIDFKDLSDRTIIQVENMLKTGEYDKR